MGIGFGITAHLLQHNASKIILVSQKEEHAEEAKEELKKYGDIRKVHWIQCDLKDLERTNEVAQELKNERQIDAVRYTYPLRTKYPQRFNNDPAHPQRRRRRREIQPHNRQPRLPLPSKPPLTIPPRPNPPPHPPPHPQCPPRPPLLRPPPRPALQPNIHLRAGNKHRYRA